MRLMYWQCVHCLSISTTREFVDKAVCGACDGKIKYLGKVQEDTDKRFTEVAPACDGRCTNATGPNCFCRCGCENHGTGRLVEVKTGGPVPVIVPLDADKAKERAAEYIGHRNALVRAFEAKFPGVRDRIARKAWVPRDQWDAYIQVKDIRARAAESTSHPNRIKLMKTHIEKLLGRKLTEKV